MLAMQQACTPHGKRSSAVDQARKGPYRLGSCRVSNNDPRVEVMGEVVCAIRAHEILGQGGLSNGKTKTWRTRCLVLVSGRGRLPNVNLT